MTLKTKAVSKIFKFHSKCCNHNLKILDCV